jgi:fatty-acyl-CoA synthase
MLHHHLRALRVIADFDPDRVLLISPAATRTAAELRDTSNRLAGFLATAGLRSGQPVALMMCNRHEVIEAFYAALALGSPPTNVNARYTRREIAHVLNNCRAGALIYEPAVAHEVAAARTLFDASVILIEVGGPLWRQALAHPPAPERAPRADDTLLIYTGGTTGLPRAVEWEVAEHTQMIWGMVRRDIPPPPPEQTLSRGRRAPTALPCSPFLHGVGLSLTFNTLNGAGTVVFSGEPTFDAARVLGLVQAHDVAVLGIVGDAFARPILAELERGAWQGRLGSLKAISSAGAAWSQEVRDGIAAWLPNTKLVSNFGSTEALVTRDMTNAEPFVPERPTLILDANRVPVAQGTVGLLATSGHLPIGYLREPEKNALTFPVIGGVRYAVLGDEALCEPSGRIRILGRGSSVINTGGEKVWPEEVEAVLRSHPDVLDAVVVGRDDARWGQRVSAVLAVREGATLSDESLKLLCRSRLAAYKCPKEWLQLPAVPRTAVGKPDYPGIHAALASNSGLNPVAGAGQRCS